MDAQPNAFGRELSFQSYRKRPIRFLELWKPNGWQIKVYGISALTSDSAPNLVDPGLLAHGKATAAASAFGKPPQSDAHGFGFLILHQGLLANWLLLDWWVNEIWLYHQLYRSPFERPSEFSRVDSDLIACIWELRVVEFERAAWISAMLESREGSEPERYLGARLNALV